MFAGPYSLKIESFQVSSYIVLIIMGFSLNLMALQVDNGEPTSWR